MHAALDLSPSVRIHFSTRRLVLQITIQSITVTKIKKKNNDNTVPPAYYAHLAAFRARFYVEPENDTVEENGPTMNDRPPSSRVRALPALKENVKRVMFYC